MRIVCVLSSHDRLGDTGRPTGTWLEELLTPYYRLRAAQVEVQFASPAGGSIPVDPASMEALKDSDLLRRYEKDAQLQAALSQTTPLAAVDPNDFDGALYPGGHGPLYDLRANGYSISLIEVLLGNSKPVGVICHAGAVLLNARNPSGSPLAKGRALTAFTDSEEQLVGLAEIVPYAVESELRRQGAKFTRAGDWAAHVVVDGFLITGQNPASAAGVADAMLEALLK